MDLRFMPAMPDADSPRFIDHERTLARPIARCWPIPDIAFAETFAVRDLRHYRANVGQALTAED